MKKEYNKVLHKENLEAKKIKNIGVGVEALLIIATSATMGAFGHHIDMEEYKRNQQKLLACENLSYSILHNNQDDIKQFLKEKGLNADIYFKYEKVDLTEDNSVTFLFNADEMNDNFYITYEVNENKDEYKKAQEIALLIDAVNKRYGELQQKFGKYVVSYSDVYYQCFVDMANNLQVVTGNSENTVHYSYNVQQNTSTQTAQVKTSVRKR